LIPYVPEYLFIRNDFQEIETSLSNRKTGIIKKLSSDDMEVFKVNFIE
jgi:hypothetical protein